LRDNREPGGPITAWSGSIALNEDALDDILVDRKAECVRDLLGNLTAAHARVAPFHLDHRGD
jgi:hypothetical protein